MNTHEETPEAAYLAKLEKNLREAEAASSAPIALPESAFSICLDYKTLENFVYQDTLQAYDALIDTAVSNARHSYLARMCAARTLYERKVVINNETISGVISGEIAYLRAQAEFYLWSRIVSCPVALTVLGNKDAVLTTIPLARFAILHLSERDLQVDEEDYLLVKKSKDGGENGKMKSPVFDGEFLIVGSVSAVSKTS